jgi:hypothetical protein
MIVHRKPWILGLVVTFAIYAPAALWLQYSFDSPKAPKDTVLQLNHFSKLSHDRFGYMSLTQRLKDLAETEEGPPGSPVILYEDGKPLGPAHRSQTDIEDIGLGRFLHLRRVGFFFSASDNSDPRTNGRNYWVVLPSK